MLVASVVATCILALVGVFRTLPVDSNGISATLARIQLLVPTISAPSRTLRISSSTSPGPLLLVRASPRPVIKWTIRPQITNDTYRGHEEAPSLPPKVHHLTLASRTIPGVPANTDQRVLLWTASLVIATSVLVSVSCMVLPARALLCKSHEDDHGQHAVMQARPEVRHLLQLVGDMRYDQRPQSKPFDDDSQWPHERAAEALRDGTPGPDHPTSRSASASTYQDSSTCHITPTTSRVDPVSTNGPSLGWGGDHTSRRVFGVPIPTAQAPGRNSSSLDDLDDGVTYLRDALGLIDWSDVPPQCGYWPGPTLDDHDRVAPGEDGARPCQCSPWYRSDEDLRRWVFPAGRVLPGRSEPVQPSVAGEG